MKNLISPLLVLVLLLGACSGNEEIKLEDKSFANTLLIQKVENNSSSEEMTKIVTDKEKLIEVLSLVEGLKVENINTDTFMEKLNSQSSYMFVFFEERISGEKGKFAFYILEDGTILFNGNPAGPLMTKEKQLDLLNELKQTLEMDF